MGSETLRNSQMTDIQGRTESFRRLHVAGEPLVLFNVWDAGSTKVVALACEHH
jgi:2-methylisocitrate lyase-like PEP mutase family enzyme